MSAVPYLLPTSWILYNQRAAFDALVEAKSVIRALQTTPYQRDWVESLQKLQLKMEVAGTSRIEGAEFSEQELELALSGSPEDLSTRSQRQARAAADTYRWIATLPDDLPMGEDLICDVHRRMVRGCDEDHCEPGRIRRKDHNVVFGIPRHRGCEGGEKCEQAFSSFARAMRTEFLNHDPLIQAIAVHYHLAAMHPFGDGNGRTARSLEALVLQRAGIRDTAFIAMSNYYYEEKPSYLRVLAEVRQRKQDLTPFVLFALKGVAKQCSRLLDEISRNIKKAMFRNTMFDLFKLLESPKRRVVRERQLKILKLLLKEEQLDLPEIIKRSEPDYAGLKDPRRALLRDLNGLLHLEALFVEEPTLRIRINLDWPSQIRESEFLDKVKSFPRAKTSLFL